MDLSNYFKKSSLIPAVIVDDDSNEVLMLAYMNEESMQKTLDTGYTWFYSRSRQELWNKGATSGHTQKVVSVTGDCDNDTLLIRVKQKGPACHTGSRTCFFNKILGGDNMIDKNALYALRDVIHERKNSPQEGSYTCYLFEKGLDKILKKCGEENAEMIIAAKNSSKDELANEICDLFYHVLVLMEEKDVPLDMIMDILDTRSQKIGNLKKIHKVDRNS